MRLFRPGHFFSIASLTSAGVSGRLLRNGRLHAGLWITVGVPRSIAMKITGQRTEAVYRRCAIVNEADVAEGLGRLAGFLAL